MKNSLLTVLVLVASAALAQAAPFNVERSKQIHSVYLKQNGTHLVVSGTVNRGVASHRVIGDHVHVQMTDSKGKNLGTVAQSLAPKHPQGDAASNHRVKYSVGFPSSEFTKASTVRVHYVSIPHRECETVAIGKQCSSC